MNRRLILALVTVLSTSAQAQDGESEREEATPATQPPATQDESAGREDSLSEPELIFDPTEEISEDLSVSFPTDI